MQASVYQQLTNETEQMCPSLDVQSRKAQRLGGMPLVSMRRQGLSLNQPDLPAVFFNVDVDVSDLYELTMPVTRG